MRDVRRVADRRDRWLSARHCRNGRVGSLANGSGTDELAIVDQAESSVGQYSRKVRWPSASEGKAGRSTGECLRAAP